ncbi:MAG TPA: 2-dehydropantoate 2-reductase N-terminal domain-containing protein [Anaeromyxobacter sp.]
MKAVIFGPGRIGCGFVGQLLQDSGYDIVFVGRGATVEHLARVGRYAVRLTDGRRTDEVQVRGVRALSTSQEEAVAAEVASADLVAVSVGPQNLGAVAPLLAAGLSRRTSPVNVIAFENCNDPAGCLKEAVFRIAPALREIGHGFSGAIVSRIVARRIGDPAGSEPLVFLGDPPEGFIVHGPSLRAPLPRIAGLRAVDDYAAWLMKKLYTFSAGHAAAAYLGALKGYRYVHTAVRDPEIRKAVRAAMEEGRRGLARRFGRELAGDRRELEAILKRFENAALDDPVIRVGRDPMRKLGREDRLVGAARLAAEAGVQPRRLALVAAAAMCFGCAADSGLGTCGPEATLRTVSGLDPHKGLGREVATAFTKLTEGREQDNVLLSLHELVWSWARKQERGAQPALRLA